MSAGPPHFIITEFFAIEPGEDERPIQVGTAGIRTLEAEGVLERRGGTTTGSQQ
jgi:hypothetical protein